MSAPEVHLGLNPNRRRTATAKEWRAMARKMIESPDRSTRDLGYFLNGVVGIYKDPFPVTMRVDDYHAQLIYDAVSAKGKVKA
jgi:hypothetical protein